MPVNHQMEGTGSRPGQESRRGLVFNIQRFSIHDGPGIRTTVFLKGCPLNCPWCSNPESKDFRPNLMVRDINCKACGTCKEACPEGAITIDEDRKRKIDWSKCNHCLLCAGVCIYNSLNICGRYMDASDVINEVIRDDPFYKNSGGGITVSGGEPLSQSEFVLMLLQGSKEKGLHTVLDTTGHAPWEKIERLLPFVDLFLWDIKHLDPEKHLKTTGVGNQLILENLKKASKMKDIWLRVPLIAGFNDSEEHIMRITELASDIGAKKLSLLPYHEGGKSKSEQMGRPYPFPQGKAPAEDHVAYLKSQIEKSGIKASIGS